MRRKQWLAVLALLVLTLLAALPGMLGTGADEPLSVAVAPGEGFEIISENPLSVSRGETASFQISIEEGYSFSSASVGSYSDGVLSVPNVRFGRTVYLDLLKQCSISLDAGEHGSAQLMSPSAVMEGTQVTISLSPESGYVPGPIEVNGFSYPAPSDNSFSFVAEDDSRVSVSFLGESLDFLIVSGNLGYVQVHGGGDTYRYGDELSFDCTFDGDTVFFEGWSLGGFLSEGGEKVSDSVDYRHKLTEDTVLYANFADRSSYRLSYDANGGRLSQPLQEEHAPGEYVNLALYSSDLYWDGHTLIGFSTSPDGGDIMSPGAMLVMPREDITLYARWAEHTDIAYLDYSINGGAAVIRGFSEAGIEAGLSALVIPPEIDGRQVTNIGSSAFSGSEGLETVVLPMGLSMLGYRCFSDCSSLSTVYFPDSLTYISDDSFADSPVFTNMRVIASLDTVYDLSYDSALAGKYMRLKNTEGKRIILVAGSNLAFGIDSAMLQERFPDYSIINFGVSGHYGALPLFDLLRANVHEGDIVVFCPEYSYASYAAIESPTPVNWQYLEVNYDILKDLNIQNNPGILSQFTEFLSVKKTYLPGKKLSVNPAYSASGFNRFGDVVVARDAGENYGFKVPDSGIITDQGMAAFNAVFKDLTEKGAHCCFSFTANPGGTSSAQQRDAALAGFVEKLEKGLDSRYVTVISNMSDYFFPGQIFYDSPYHLTLEGAKLRTEQLLRDLEAYMEVLK